MALRPEICLRYRTDRAILCLSPCVVGLLLLSPQISYCSWQFSPNSASVSCECKRYWAVNSWLPSRACLGQCFSYSVPNTFPQSTESLVHCDSCMPTQTQWDVVSRTLSECFWIQHVKVGLQVFCLSVSWCSLFHISLFFFSLFLCPLWTRTLHAHSHTHTY